MPHLALSVECRNTLVPCMHFRHLKDNSTLRFLETVKEKRSPTWCLIFHRTHQSLSPNFSEHNFLLNCFKKSTLYNERPKSVVWRSVRPSVCPGIRFDVSMSVSSSKRLTHLQFLKNYDHYNHETLHNSTFLKVLSWHNNTNDLHPRSQRQRWVENIEKY